MKWPQLFLVFTFGFFFSASSYAQEICDNAIDDDLDGLIDLNDTLDCPCISQGGGTEVPSIIPNPSFEDYSCCPTQFSQLSCADSWVQATDPTTDYWHNCDSTPSDMLYLPPPPDGDGMVGAFILDGWQEYVGGCLLSPMAIGTDYTLSFWIASTGVNISLFSGWTGVCPFDVPIDITLYGYDSCPTFPLTTDDCPEPLGWVELGTVNYTPVNQWQEVTINFTPGQEIQAVMLGGPCNLPPGYPISELFACLPYFVFDDLTLNESVLFGANVDVDGNLCTDNLTLTGHPEALGDYQWFLDGVALVGETDTVLDISGEGYGSGDFSFQTFLDQNTCAIATVNIPILEYPVVDFVGNNLSGCAPLAVDFTNLSDPGLSGSCNWDFGNGETSSDCDPSTSYLAPGSYSVNLSITSDEGCTSDSTFVDYVVVDGPAQNIAIEGSLCTNDLVLIGYSETNGNYQWLLDGGELTGENDTILDVSGGGYGTGIFSFQINSNPNPCALATINIPTPTFPLVDFSGSNVNGCAPLAVDFTNLSDPNLPGSCLWDFGNGETSTDCNPSISYLAPGTYSVTLTVTLDDGCTSDSTFVDYIVVDASAETLTVEGHLCTNDLVLIGYSETNGNYQWLQDGIVLIGENDTILDVSGGGYGPGFYSFQTTSNPSPCGLATVNVPMPDYPEVDFSGSDLVGCAPLDVNFTNLSEPNSGGCFWDLGNGETSSNCDPSISYLDPGSYSVNLSITSDEGCTSDSTFVNYIIVDSSPEMDIDVAMLGGCGSRQIALSQTPTPQSGIDVLWDFGDGETSTEINPTHLYVADGTYTVTLTNTSPNGCEGSAQQTVLIDASGDLSELIVPNVFSPNGDGMNDELVIGGGADISECIEVQIFNRWGQEVFSSTKNSASWDGTMNGNDADEGTYFYMIKANSLQWRGSITLVR